MYFNPPALWGAGRRKMPRYVRRVIYFNPPALWGAGPCFRRAVRQAEQFQSTRPVGGGTGSCATTQPTTNDFNPPALWGAGRRSRSPAADPADFNPPALWGAGLKGVYPITVSQLISIHPPCGGRDVAASEEVEYIIYFNPPALWGAGPLRVVVLPYTIVISIHPPCGGRDSRHPSNRWKS